MAKYQLLVEFDYRNQTYLTVDAEDASAAMQAAHMMLSDNPNIHNVVVKGCQEEVSDE